MNGEPGFAVDRRESYRTWTYDKLRFGDTDRNGHINNAAIATFLESGRVAALDVSDTRRPPPGTVLMIVRLIVDFRAELFYPGVVDIGTRILRLGRASFTMAQAVFAGDSCAATAESTCVLVDTETRRAVPVPEALRRELLEM